MAMSLKRTLGLRLSVWYATVFILSTVALVAITYVLLASSLAQRDHDIVRATLREYATRYELGGLGALRSAVELEERTSGRERLFVRVIGPGGADAVFARTPPGWRDFAQEGRGDPGGGAGSQHDERAVVEVASARLYDGTILQVGK